MVSIECGRFRALLQAWLVDEGNLQTMCEELDPLNKSPSLVSLKTRVLQDAQAMRRQCHLEEHAEYDAAIASVIAIVYQPNKVLDEVKAFSQEQKDKAKASRERSAARKTDGTAGNQAMGTPVDDLESTFEAGATLMLPTPTDDIGVVYPAANAQFRKGAALPGQPPADLAIPVEVLPAPEPKELWHFENEADKASKGEEMSSQVDKKQEEAGTLDTNAPMADIDVIRPPTPTPAQPMDDIWTEAPFTQDKFLPVSADAEMAPADIEVISGDGEPEVIPETPPTTKKVVEIDLDDMPAEPINVDESPPTVTTGAVIHRDTPTKEDEIEEVVEEERKQEEADEIEEVVEKEQKPEEEEVASTQPDVVAEEKEESGEPKRAEEAVEEEVDENEAEREDNDTYTWAGLTNTLTWISDHEPNKTKRREIQEIWSAAEGSLNEAYNKIGQPDFKNNKHIAFFSRTGGGRPWLVERLLALKVITVTEAKGIFDELKDNGRGIRFINKVSGTEKNVTGFVTDVQAASKRYFLQKKLHPTAYPLTPMDFVPREWVGLVPPENPNGLLDIAEMNHLARNERRILAGHEPHAKASDPDDDFDKTADDWVKPTASDDEDEDAPKKPAAAAPTPAKKKAPNSAPISLLGVLDESSSGEDFEPDSNDEKEDEHYEQQLEGEEEVEDDIVDPDEEAVAPAPKKKAVAEEGSSRRKSSNPTKKIAGEEWSDGKLVSKAPKREPSPLPVMKPKLALVASALLPNYDEVREKAQNGERKMVAALDKKRKTSFEPETTKKGDGNPKKKGKSDKAAKIKRQELSAQRERQPAPVAESLALMRATISGLAEGELRSTKELVAMLDTAHTDGIISAKKKHKLFDTVYNRLKKDATEVLEALTSSRTGKLIHRKQLLWTMLSSPEFKVLPTSASGKRVRDACELSGIPIEADTQMFRMCLGEREPPATYFIGYLKPFVAINSMLRLQDAIESASFDANKVAETMVLSYRSISQALTSLVPKPVPAVVRGK